MLSKLFNKLSAFTVPRETAHWRYGIQLSTVLFMTGWVSCNQTVNNKLFSGNGRWISSTAASLLSTSVGTTYQRALLKSLAIILGCILIMSIVAIPNSMRYNSDSDSLNFGHLIAYFLIASTGLLYNCVLTYSATLKTLVDTAVFYTPVILGSGLHEANAIAYTVRRAITVLIGVIVSTFVSRAIVPHKTKVLVISNLCTIIDNLCFTLEPLLMLQGGIIRIDDFTYQNTRLTQEGLKRTEWKLLNVQLWKANRELIWTKLESTGRLINSQLSDLQVALFEITFRRENKLNMHIYREILMNVRILYYELCSIHFSIENHMMAYVHEINANQLRSGLHETKTPYFAQNNLTPSIRRLKKQSTYCRIINDYVKNLVSALNAYKLMLKLNTAENDAEKYIMRAAAALEKFHDTRAQSQRLLTIAIDHGTGAEFDLRSKKLQKIYTAQLKKMMELSSQNYMSMSDVERNQYWENFWLFNVRLSVTDMNLMSLFTSVLAFIFHIKRFINARRSPTELLNE